MTTRKTKPLPDPAPALWFTKEEFAAVVITSGVFAGPYGKTVMEAKNPEEALAGVAEAALNMYAVLLKRIEARHA